MRLVNTDVAVIGAGTAGLAAYRAAKAAGASAVLIEGGVGGTTCARVGCMPSKLLIAAAEAAHAPTRWDEFGLRLDGALRIDGPAVMARVKRERDRFVGFVTESVEGIPRADRLSDQAQFVTPFKLTVGDHTEVQFKRAVIATGSAPIVPKMLAVLGDRLVINDDVFDWNDLPRRVVVFGPGVIGLELGQALTRLGVEVSMFGLSGSVGPFADPAVRAYAAATFAASFLFVRNAKDLAVERIAAGIRVSYRAADGALATVEADLAIAAVGRAPNVRQLGLEHTGVTLDTSGVPLFDRTTLRIGTSHLFIAGDANADVPLLHEAADEGRIAGDNAGRYPNVQAGPRRAPIGIVFTDPQLAVIGNAYSSLKHGSFVTGVVSFEDQGRSRVMLRNQGLLHVYAERGTGRFLGAEMIGPDAEHIAHLLAWARQLDLTVAQMLALPFYHPVVEEGLRTALRDAQAKLDEAEPVSQGAGQSLAA